MTQSSTFYILVSPHQNTWEKCDLISINVWYFPFIFQLSLKKPEPVQCQNYSLQFPYHTICKKININFFYCRMMQMYRKIHKFSELLSYFCMRSWQFSNKNTVNLWHKMNSADRHIFPMSMSDVHWLNYMRTYMQGVRRYLIKDSDSSLEEARKKSRR